MSPTALQRILGLWNALGFLDSETNYQSEKQFPHLGTIVLRMQRGVRERAAEINWTKDPNAFELANQYRRLAEQVIFVFEITVARENQPLEAPKLLKRLESMISRNDLFDPSQLIPLLSDLKTDERIPLIGRNQAERLLKKLEKQK